jgi:glycosyltransferase involved in cell wall biosynthesis
MQILIYGDPLHLKISIALCTYNGAQFLQEQLESIAHQTRIPDEMIICDDKSKDGTLEVVKNFASKAPFPVKLFVNEKNLGSSRNFEKAIGLCTGDIIFLSDQDDFWHHDKLDKIEKVFMESPSTGAVFANAEVVDENLIPLGYTLWDSIGFGKRRQIYFNKGKSIEILLQRNVVTGSTMAFRADFKNVLLPVPLSWVHDGWIALIIAFISDLETIPESLIKYRQHQMQQIGAGNEPLNISEKISQNIDKLKKVKDSFHDSQLECDRSLMVYNRLVSSQFPSTKWDKVSLLKARIKHFEIRANLPVNRTKRILFLVKELLNLNYHRYSDGFSSFGGDLLRDNPRLKSK